MRASLRALTPRTITDPATLREELQRVRAQGWCLLDQELEVGVRSIAFPLHDANQKVVGAANASAHVARVPLEHMREHYVPALRQCAAERDRDLASPGDNTTQIMDDRGTQSCRGRWPATPYGATKKVTGVLSPIRPMNSSVTADMPASGNSPCLGIGPVLRRVEPHRTPDDFGWLPEVLGPGVVKDWVLSWSVLRAEAEWVSGGVGEDPERPCAAG